MRILAFVSFFIGVFSTAAAVGQTDLANVGRGQSIARSVCADCHLVEGGDESGPKMKAPAFQEIAYEPSTTAMSLRAFLRTPHRDMPNLVLPENDTADIVAYILSLK